jgi:hypothetical protein
LSPENPIGPIEPDCRGQVHRAGRAIAEYLAETKKFARSIVKTALPIVKPAWLTSGAAHRHVRRDDENNPTTFDVVT